MSKFEISFFELAFLAEACIPPVPIARNYFWQKLIDIYYNQLTPDERIRLYTWINENKSFQLSLEKGNDDCILFNARYNPDNQYNVKTSGSGVIHTFLYKDKYHVGKTTFISPEQIKSVKKL